jgi:hypothetical protein
MRARGLEALPEHHAISENFNGRDTYVINDRVECSDGWYVWPRGKQDSSQAPSALLTEGPQASITWDAAMLESLSRLLCAPAKPAQSF